MSIAKQKFLSIFSALIITAGLTVGMVKIQKSKAKAAARANQPAMSTCH